MGLNMTVRIPGIAVANFARKRMRAAGGGKGLSWCVFGTNYPVRENWAGRNGQIVHSEWPRRFPAGNEKRSIRVHQCGGAFQRAWHPPVHIETAIFGVLGIGEVLDIIVDGS